MYLSLYQHGVVHDIAQQVAAVGFGYDVGHILNDRLVVCRRAADKYAQGVELAYGFLLRILAEPIVFQQALPIYAANLVDHRLHVPHGVRRTMVFHVNLPKFIGKKALNHAARRLFVATALCDAEAVLRITPLQIAKAPVGVRSEAVHDAEHGVALQQGQIVLDVASSSF